MNNNDARIHSLPARILCGLCSLSLLVPQLAWGLPTAIADTPLGVGIDIPPAMIFGLDDSGSMDYEVLMPTSDGALWWNTDKKTFVGFNKDDDYQPGSSEPNFNSSGNYNNTWKKYVYLFPNSSACNDAAGMDYCRHYGDNKSHYAIPPTKQFAWVRSSTYNPLFYDSKKTYKPWSPAHNGSSVVSFNPVQNPEKPVRSHPLYENPGHNETQQGRLSLITPLAADKYGADWRFEMQSGMIVPAGSRVQLVANGPWTNITADTLLENIPGNTGRAQVQIPYIPATFYEPYNPQSSAPADAPIGPDGKKLKKYVIENAGGPYPGNRSYADELQNFANWYLYHRKRHLMLNGALGSVLGGITGIRAGVVYFNKREPVTLYNMSSTNPSENSQGLIYKFYSRLPGSTDGTPTRDTLDYIGKQFQRTDTNDPPIKYECQANIAFIMTDGFNNTSGELGSYVGNVDIDGQSPMTPIPYNKQYDGAGGWKNTTHPYADSTNKNTLADIAMYYYITHLRSDMAKGKVRIDTNDNSPNADRNQNLHMNTYALGLGAQGVIFGTNSAATADPFSTPFTWPKPTSLSPSTIDDLWHATLNSRGGMFSSTDTTSTRAAIDTIISAVLSKKNSSAAAAVSNPRLTSSDQRVYASTFNASNWTGSLHAWGINVNTGQVSSIDQWSPSVQEQLKTVDADARLIMTYDPTSKKGVLFNTTGNGTESGLSSTQIAKLNNSAGGASANDAEDVINYLRGDRSKEYNPTDPDTKDHPYRYRPTLLGDIVHAQTGILIPPSEDYTDTGYNAFVTDKKSRKKLILQGSNDGMLHAFHYDTGAELWAYIPNRVIEEGNLPKLTQRDGFQHHYYVDGTPTIADVDFGNIKGGTGSPDWRTLFIGSLQKGGRGFYALDLTDPATTETAASLKSKILWEFPRADTAAAANIGYSFGRPVVAKLPDGKWYVLVSSGYNNDGATTGGNGKGILYILNPKTGDVVYTMETPAGTADTPSGLAYISAFKDKYPRDATARYVYGGDLEGNIWRFDLSDPTKASNVKKLATLVDKDGVKQPITTAPQIANVQVRDGVGKQPILFYGTGRYLDKSDITATSQTQTVYGLLDDGTEITDLRKKLVKQTLTDPDSTTGKRKLTNNSIDYTAKRGWYVDLNVSGERVNVDPALAYGILVVGSNIPSTDICLPAGRSYINYFDFKTGGLVKGMLTSSTPYEAGVVGVQIVSTGEEGFKTLSTFDDASVRSEEFPIPSVPTDIRRTTWRELVER